MKAKCRSSSKFAIGAAALVLASAAVGGAAFADAPVAPANDNVGQAIALTPKNHDLLSARGVQAAFDPTSATLQSSEPQPSGGACTAASHTAWYFVQTTDSEYVQIRAFSRITNVQPEVAVYTGALPSVQVGCGVSGTDSSGPYSPSVVFTTSPGTKYWVQVGITTSALGAINMTAYYANNPGQDTIANAVTLSTPNLYSLTSADADSPNLDDAVLADPTLATIEPNEPQPTGHGCTAVARTRWFTWTSDVASGSMDAMPLGRATIETAVWTGTDGPTQLLGCTTANNNDVVRFALSSGKKLWFQLASTASSGWADAQLLFDIHTTPVNDMAARATNVPYSKILTGNGTFVGYDNTLATLDSGEPQPSSCATNVGATQWFKISVPYDSYLYVEDYSTFNGGPTRAGSDVIALYSGASAPTTPVVCGRNDGSKDDPNTLSGSGPGSYTNLSKVVKGGTTYWLQVGGTNGQAPTGTLYLRAQHLVPTLVQDSKNGQVLLTTFTSPGLSGTLVQFTRRSGLTGQVVPCGNGYVNNDGVVQRVLNVKTGQILAIYSKVLAYDMLSQFSNTVTFKVK